jgi:CRP-like cAMP-binding protein
MLHRLPKDIRELGWTPVFRGLANRDLDALQRLGTTVVRGPGERLVRSRQSSSQMVVIVTGEVVATTDDGRSRTLSDGACFGAFHPWDDLEPEGVEAITHVTLFVVGRRELATIRRVYPHIADRLTAALLTTPAPDARAAGRREGRQSAVPWRVSTAGS